MIVFEKDQDDYLHLPGMNQPAPIMVAMVRTCHWCSLPGTAQTVWNRDSSHRSHVIHYAVSLHW